MSLSTANDIVNAVGAEQPSSEVLGPVLADAMVEGSSTLASNRLEQASVEMEVEDGG
ncbi:hypothetical protein M419DRAFT_7202 [Trichoderma reesei RUT C-30]|uniref:Uncharacterized protein n=1 Tax=Hypocrea jecorina (strain ATCC 56765 / BCRC 32924 / NRRL 11460 / Rut C-30) TaxID=1344414 RepID=A0A024SDU6_HYPJR|nr:hypothetical protein M419DRAFT_7202 [Trichoderma reesei RUT C-30]